MHKKDTIGTTTVVSVERRRLVVLGVLGGAALTSFGPPGAHADEPPATPSPSEPLPPTLLFPERTGRLPDARQAVLAAIFADIGRRWRNAAYNPIDRQRFLSIAALKSAQTPSYLSEYLLATQTYLDWSAQHGPARAMDMLFAIPADASLTTVAGHVRTFTLSELLQLQVSQGAFRWLGYVNYPGFAGGRYNDPSRLPYRRA